MIKSKVVIVTLALSLNGCALFGAKSTEEQQTIYVDRAVTAPTPKPKVPPRPRLPIEDLTPEQMKDIGELSKAFNATIKAVEGYVVTIETVIDGIGNAPVPTDPNSK